ASARLRTRHLRLVRVAAGEGMGRVAAPAWWGPVVGCSWSHGLAERARQQVGHADALGPTGDVRAIQARPLCPQDAEDVAPLPIRRLPTAPKPFELAHYCVLRGIDPQNGAGPGADGDALPARHTVAIERIIPDHKHVHLDAARKMDRVERG